MTENQTDLELVVSRAQNLRPRTKTIYLDAVRSFLAHAGRDPAGWTGLAVESWRDAMREGAQAQTVNLKMAGLKFASKRRAKLAQNPLLDFADAADKLVVERKKKRLALTVEEVGAMIDTCAGGRPIDLRDRAIIVLGVRTGMRREGMAGLTLEDVQLPLVAYTKKGGQRETITVDAECVEALGAWLVVLRDRSIASGKLFRSVGRERLDGTVKVGSGLSINAIAKILKARARKAGVARSISPHILRHTFVSWCFDNGLPDHRIVEMTGHESTRSLDTYRHDVKASSDPVGNHLPPLLRR